MRALEIVLLGGIVIMGANLMCTSVDNAQGDERAGQQVAEPKLVRPDDVEYQFEVPEPMSFDGYCAKFGKQYAAESERLMREKVYLAMALRSQVAYLLGAQDYFLGPTPFSDRTREEQSRVCPSCFANRSKDEGRRAARESAQNENEFIPAGEGFSGGNRQNGLPLRAAWQPRKQAPARAVRPPGWISDMEATASEGSKTKETATPVMRSRSSPLSSTCIVVIRHVAHK
jgi:hypothetical protein